MSRFAPDSKKMQTTGGDILWKGGNKLLQTAARWTCRRWRNTSSVVDMLDELEWSSMSVFTGILHSERLKYLAKCIATQVAEEHFVL